MTHDDQDLRAAFESLRAHDAAPSFEATLASARGAARARHATKRRAAAAVVVVAIAAALLLAVLRPGDTPTPALRYPEPLAFLARPPSASVIGGEPLGRAEETF